jgi:hypothetical protein
VSRGSGWRAILVLLALALPSCDTQKDVPEGPSQVGPGRFASVKIEYRQPNGCQNPGTEHCNDLVWFFGSWMHPGEELSLARTPGSFTWTGVAEGVPVNWPPTDAPHLVRVFDPHLVSTPTGGVTASRLSVGGQAITDFDSPGTSSESGLIYVDDNGVGRNPL